MRRARRDDAPEAAWGRRMLRLWWPDSNPLRRAADRAEAVIAACLLATFVIGGAAGGVLAGRWAYTNGMRTLRSQASWHEVPALLLATAPSAGSAETGSYALPSVPARWVVPGGGHRVGKIFVAPGSLAGSRVQIWVDGSGRLTGPALRYPQVVGNTALTALLVPILLGALLSGAGFVSRRVLNRRRLAAWDAAWQVTGPRWTSQSR